MSVSLGWPGARVIEVGDFPSAWAQAATHPDLIMCDLGMPGAAPYDGIAGVIAAAPGVPVLVVTGIEDDELLLKLFDLGIAGFLPKSSHGAIIEAAIRLILAGGSYIPRHILELASARKGGAGRTTSAHGAASLTGRQIEVLKRLGEGKSNKEIAREFDLSPATVRAHASAIYLALGAANRTEAVMRGTELGLL